MLHTSTVTNTGYKCVTEIKVAGGMKAYEVKTSQGAQGKAVNLGRFKSSCRRRLSCEVSTHLDRSIWSRIGGQGEDIWQYAHTAADARCNGWREAEHG